MVQINDKPPTCEGAITPHGSPFPKRVNGWVRRSPRTPPNLKQLKLTSIFLSQTPQQSQGSAEISVNPLRTPNACRHTHTLDEYC